MLAPALEANDRVVEQTRTKMVFIKQLSVRWIIVTTIPPSE
jgi:hypothetical protein